MRTHEGAPAAWITPMQQLRRSVCSCLLWEKEFYESGKTIAARIVELVGQCETQKVTDLAMDVRSHFHLRHVPLLLLAAVAAPGRGGSRMIGDAIRETIQRPDELSEFVAIYAQVYGVAPSAVRKRMSAQVKKGLAAAFNKFDAYQLGKYFSQSGEKGAVVRGRDVLFLTHARPRDEQQKELFRRIAAKEAVVDGGVETWEVALSSGKDKRETFEALLRDEQIGYLALLRNLRNMVGANVDQELIRNAILARKGARRVLPFRYVAAARAVPSLEPFLDQALSESIAEMPPLPGKTVVLVDVSGSMVEKLSSKSDLTRMDAAATLAAIIPGDVRMFTFSNHLAEVPARRGMAGVAAIINSQAHLGTNLGSAVSQLIGSYHYSRVVNGDRVSGGGVPYDRLIVLTDEQSHDHVPEPHGKAYMINVASAQNGVGYGAHWTHIDGFSEQTLRFIREFEALGAV